MTSLLRARLITYEDIKALNGNSNNTMIASRDNPNDMLMVSRANASYHPQYNVGKTLWWLYENTLDYRLSTSNITGATPNVYQEQDPESYYNSETPSYWTLSPGIKTPGIVGQNQVGIDSFAVAVVGLNYTQYSEDDDKYAAGAQFSYVSVKMGIRPVIGVPVAQVRLHNE